MKKTKNTMKKLLGYTTTVKLPLSLFILLLIYATMASAQNLSPSRGGDFLISFLEFLVSIAILALIVQVVRFFLSLSSSRGSLPEGTPEKIGHTKTKAGPRPKPGPTSTGGKGGPKDSGGKKPMGKPKPTANSKTLAEWFTDNRISDANAKISFRRKVGARTRKLNLIHDMIVEMEAGKYKNVIKKGDVEAKATAVKQFILDLRDARGRNDGKALGRMSGTRFNKLLAELADEIKKTGGGT